MDEDVEMHNMSIVAASASRNGDPDDHDRRLVGGSGADTGSVRRAKKEKRGHVPLALDDDAYDVEGGQQQQLQLDGGENAAHLLALRRAGSLGGLHLWLLYALTTVAVLAALSSLFIAERQRENGESADGGRDAGAVTLRDAVEAQRLRETGAVVYVYGRTPPCTVWCEGSPVLAAVQEAKLFPASERFVDMPLLVPPAAALAAFERLGPVPSTDALKTFIAANFAAVDSELMAFAPLDFTDKPPFTSLLVDHELAEFATALNRMWFTLGRVQTAKVAAHPTLFSRIAVRHPHFSPGTAWDSYWVVKGLLVCGMVDTARGVVNNYLDLINNFGFVPAGNRKYLLNRSQPPLTAAMVDDLFEYMRAYAPNAQAAEFLRLALPDLDEEYAWWMRHRSVEVGPATRRHTLNRYYARGTKGPRPEAYRQDKEIAEMALKYADARHRHSAAEREAFKERIYIHLASASESGWELSSRWFADGKNAHTIDTSNIVPVCLNTFLHRTERTLEKLHGLLGDTEAQKRYAAAATARVAAMTDVFFDAKLSLWRDYSLTTNEHTATGYASNFLPLWGLAYDPAVVDVDKVLLSLQNSGLLHENGVVASTPAHATPAAGSDTPLMGGTERWDFPNCFPPIVHMIVEGVDATGTRHGVALAESVAAGWIRSAFVGWKQQAKAAARLSRARQGMELPSEFTTTTGMFEDYDVTVAGAEGRMARNDEAMKLGYAWSNGVALHFLFIYGERLRLSGSSVPAPCSVWCTGPLLAAAQMAEPPLYPDSTYFPDMPLVPGKSPADVLEAFRRLALSLAPAGADANTPLSAPDFPVYPRTADARTKLLAFIDEHFFAAGVDVRPFPPQDYKENPPLLSRVVDPAYRAFIKTLNAEWQELTRAVKRDVLAHPDNYSIFPLNNPFVVGGRASQFRSAHYWDSYWIVRGLLACDMADTAVGIVSNFLDIVAEFGFVPAASRKYYLNRSNPPVLTLMVRGVVDWLGEHKPTQHVDTADFVRRALPLLDKEYQFWMTHRVVELHAHESGVLAAQRSDKTHTIRLNVYRVDADTGADDNGDGEPDAAAESGLGVIDRLGQMRMPKPGGHPRPEEYRHDVNLARFVTRARADGGWGDAVSRRSLYRHVSSAAESGWLFSTRWFQDRKLLPTVAAENVIPVDLNAYMYAVEAAMASLYHQAANVKKALFYQDAAKARLEAIRTVLWSETDNQWLDYDHVRGAAAPRPTGVVSNFAPLWTNAYDDSYDLTAIIEAFKQSGLVAPGGIITTDVAINGDDDDSAALPPTTRAAAKATTMAGHRRLHAVGDADDLKLPLPDISGFEQRWDYPSVWPALTLQIIEAFDAMPSQEAREFAFTRASDLIKTIHLNWKQYGLTFASYNGNTGAPSARFLRPAAGTNAAARAAPTAAVWNGDAGLGADYGNGYAVTNAVAIVLAHMYGGKLQSSDAPIDETPIPCRIWCYGSILEAVSAAAVFPDPKTFVDMPLRASVSLDGVDAAFLALRDRSPAALKSFVETYFHPAGSDLDEHTPYDYTTQPAFVSRLSDPKLSAFATGLNALWPKLGRRVAADVLANPDKHTLLPLQRPFIVAGGRFREMYYWDSYWIIKGLLVCGMADTARGIVENLLDLVQEYGYVPNGVRRYYLTRSQPPFLTMMVDAVYTWLVQSRPNTDAGAFLRHALPLLQREYDFWMRARRVELVVAATGKRHVLNRYDARTDSPRPEERQTDIETLERALAEGYSNENRTLFTDIVSAAESGWDFSSRWFATARSGSRLHGLSRLRTSQVVPVCLNSYLFRVERTLARLYTRDGQSEAGRRLTDASMKRYAAMTAVLYDRATAQWRDYHDASQVLAPGIISPEYRGPIGVISNFLPLWAGAFTDEAGPATDGSAPLVRDSGTFNVSAIIEALETSQLLGTAGVATTTVGLKDAHPSQQWDGSNAWPPLMQMVVEGLREQTERAAGRSLAFAIAQSWLRSCYKGFSAVKSAYTFEKYNANVPGEQGGGGEYTPQAGFGWTNGAALSMIDVYGDRLKLE